MKQNVKLALTLVFLGLPCVLPAQTLQHRYSFVSDATDSVGNANGTIQPPGNVNGTPATIANGLALAGGGGANYSGYLALPSGILTTTTNLTVECWFTQNTGNQWATVWDFGNNGNQNFELCPDPNRNNGDMITAFDPNNNENDLDTAIAFPNGSEQYVSVTYNNSTLAAALYYNGASNSSLTLPNNTYCPGTIGGSAGTSENWLGQDVYGDPQFQGTIYELRIWNGVVSERYLGASAILGSSVLATNLVPTSVNVTAGPALVISGAEQATVTVQLQQTGSANILATADATWMSGNTSVVTVNGSGLITAVGVGTTTVSATVGGVTAATGSITVVPQTLEHRYSFVSDASDSVGNANGTVVPPGNASGSAVTIANGLILPGGGGGGYSGYVTLPDGLLTNTTSITVECWVTQAQPNTWATVWDFANNTSVNFALCPNPGRNNGQMMTAFVPANNEDDLFSDFTFPNNSEQYVALTVSASTLLADLYVNAASVGTLTLPNSTFLPAMIGGAGGTTVNALGNDIWGDPQFQGTLYEFRIWNGAVTPLYLDASAAAGSSVVVTNLTPTMVTVNVTNTSMIGAQTQQASVTANFQQASGVTVTGAATNWTSSNPAILTVSSNGLITGQSGGSATVSATVGGVTAASVSITVQSTKPSITQEPSPASETLVIGSTANYTVTALGGGLSYQWIFGTNQIQGATNATLTLTNLTLAESGGYSVVVSNSLGSATSSVVSLTVTNAILEHRYSFVANANDSVGTANGALIAGNNPATINNGLMLPGTGTSGNPSGYVSLPEGIVSGDTSVTVECWVTQNQANEWAEIWSFGVSGGSVNFGLIPSSGSANMRVAFTPNGGEQDIMAPAGLPSGTEEYVAVTYNNSNLTGNLFLNGSLYASAVFPNSNYSPGNFGNTPEDVFGLDPFGGDAQFNGTIYELRIWNGVVSPLYLAVSAAVGPGTVPNLTPASISVTETNASEIVGQTEYAAVTGNFSGASGVSLTSLATNWMSSDPSVLTVNSNGLITAVGSGSAAISATVNGVVGTSAAVTVQTSEPVITNEPPASISLLVGGTLNATVGVIGNPPFTFSWYFDSGAQPVSVSASPTLTIPNVQLGSAGTYVCVVSNQYGPNVTTPLVLTVTEPTAYEQSLMGLDPLAYWPLDETNGTIAYDVAGSYNGTYMGGYALAEPGPTNAIFGTTSYSADFDGFTGYVDIPEGPFNLTNAMTVMAWFNLQAQPGHFTDVIGHGDASWRLSVNQNNPPQPGGDDGGGAPDATDTAGVGLFSWHMLAYTYAGGVGANLGVLYLDGAPQASNSFTASPAGDNLDVWIAGAPDYGIGSGNRLIAAEIAHCAVFNYALTPAEIQAAYGGTYVPPVVLTITASKPNVILTWPSGILLQATSLNGPWTTNTTTSPYTNAATAPSQYFKVLTTQ